MTQSKCPRAHMVGGTCECGWDYDRDVKQKNAQECSKQQCNLPMSRADEHSQRPGRCAYWNAFDSDPDTMEHWTCGPLGFRQTEPEPDYSQLHCRCGETFKWTGYDDKLMPWMKIHEPHLMDEYASERALSKEEFQKAILSVGIHSDIESHELSERMKRWSEKHHDLKDPEKECFYACVACSAPIHSWGMCEQCSRAWGIGHAEALNELGVTRKDIPILFAALAAMVKDIHAPQDLLSEDQWKRAEQIFSHMEKMMPSRG